MALDPAGLTQRLGFERKHPPRAFDPVPIVVDHPSDDTAVLLLEHLPEAGGLDDGEAFLVLSVV